MTDNERMTDFMADQATLLTDMVSDNTPWFFGKADENTVYAAAFMSMQSVEKRARRQCQQENAEALREAHQSMRQGYEQKIYRLIAERDELAAHIEQAKRLADNDRVDDEFYDEDGDLRTGTGWKSELGRDLHAALKKSPTASLAAHDAALIRRMAAKIGGRGHYNYYALLEMADAIERGES